MAQQVRKSYKSTSYIEGNTVRRLEEAPNFERREQADRQQRQQKKQQNHVIRKNRERASHMNLGYVLFLTVVTVIMFGVCITYLQLRSELKTNMKNVASLEAQILNLQLDNAATYKRITATIDFAQIKQVAMQELGMKYPDSTQIIYYDYKKSDYIRQYEDVPEKNKAGITTIFE